MRHKLLSGLIIGILGISSTAYSQSIQSGISAYEAEDCAPVVQDYLEKHSVAQSSIKAIDYVTTYITGGSDAGEEEDYEAWVSFNNIKGNLVIRMDRACFISQAYTTYNYKLKGVSAY